MAKKIRSWLEHKLHPYHCYCRFVDHGIDIKKARKVCTWYEKKIYKKFFERAKGNQKK